MSVNPPNDGADRVLIGLVPGTYSRISVEYSTIGSIETQTYYFYLNNRNNETETTVGVVTLTYDNTTLRLLGAERTA